MEKAQGENAGRRKQINSLTLLGGKYTSEKFSDNKQGLKSGQKGWVSSLCKWWGSGICKRFSPLSQMHLSFTGMWYYKPNYYQCILGLIHWKRKHCSPGFVTFKWVTIISGHLTECPVQCVIFPPCDLHAYTLMFQLTPGQVLRLWSDSIVSNSHTLINVQNTFLSDFPFSKQHWGPCSAFRVKVNYCFVASVM